MSMPFATVIVLSFYPPAEKEAGTLLLVSSLALEFAFNITCEWIMGWVSLSPLSMSQQDVLNKSLSVF